MNFFDNSTDTYTQIPIQAGDSIAFEIDNDSIRIRKATPLDLEFTSALVPTLSEWDSQNDDEAYNDL